MARLFIDLQHRCRCVVVEGNTLVYAFEIIDNDFNNILLKIGSTPLESISVLTRPEPSLDNGFLGGSVVIDSFLCNNQTLFFHINRLDFENLRTLHNKLNVTEPLRLYNSFRHQLESSRGFDKATFVDVFQDNIFSVFTVVDGACMYGGLHARDEICEIQKILGYPFSKPTVRTTHIANLFNLESNVSDALQFVDVILDSNSYFTDNTPNLTHAGEQVNGSTETVSDSIETASDQQFDLGNSPLVQNIISGETPVKDTPSGKVKKRYTNLMSVKQLILLQMFQWVTIICISLTAFGIYRLPDLTLLNELTVATKEQELSSIRNTFNYYNHILEIGPTQSYTEDLNLVLGIETNVIVSSIRFISNEMEISVLASDTAELLNFIDELSKDYFIDSYMLESEIASTGDTPGVFKYLLIISY